LEEGSKSEVYSFRPPERVAFFMEEDMDYFDPGFYGTDSWWRHPLYGFIYVDSVKYFCEKYSAYWVLDVIGSYKSILDKYSFLSLHFDVQENKCHFYVQEDTGLPKLIEQQIEFTDLEVSVQLFWEGGTVLFPSDH
jgi:hypothetical protein